ncbi:Hypothetical predicted protein [Olea europaea subsp. europaea]|uniref:Uncharacterized protein n=1 Tax=Olea europaea subsp. europaea TaxID=158383 RepID=A0A8S0Q2M4_OLEEU|nr:Hypothetical predicted protein [Olea europaea subsp. europaea]
MVLPSTGGDKAIGSQQDEVERLLHTQRSNEAVVYSSDGGLWMVDRLGEVMLLRWSAPPRCLIVVFCFNLCGLRWRRNRGVLGGGGVHCQIWGFFWCGLWWSCGGDGDCACNSRFVTCIGCVT